MEPQKQACLLIFDGSGRWRTITVLENEHACPFLMVVEGGDGGNQLLLSKMSMLARF